MQTRISRVTRVFYGNVRAPDGISVIEVIDAQRYNNNLESSAIFRNWRTYFFFFDL